MPWHTCMDASHSNHELNLGAYFVHGPYLKRLQPLCIPSASGLQWSLSVIVHSWDSLQYISYELSFLWASSMPMLHSGSSPLLSLSTQLKRKWMFNLRKTFKCAQIKFSVKWPQASKQMYIHTRIHNAVLLVWSSLKLASISNSMHSFTVHPFRLVRGIVNCDSTTAYNTTMQSC